MAAQLLFPSEKKVIRNSEEAKHYLKEHCSIFLEDKNLNLVASDYHFSTYSKHYRFELCYPNISLFNKFITLHTDAFDRVLSYDINGEGLSKLRSTNSNLNHSFWSEEHSKEILKSVPDFAFHLKQAALKIYLEQEQPELILEANAWTKTYNRTMLFRYDGSILENMDQERYFSDTTLQAKIFKPDPLTTLQQTYGSVYIDSNDAYQVWQDSACTVVSIPAVYSNGIFYPENQWVTLDEFENPVANPVTQSNPNFFFQRNQSGFEDMMVLYHITNFHDYIASLGYDSLMKEGVLVDAHAQGGADNSVFNRNGGSPTLCFGIGGVDDAEDADVIIHEYAHGLSWSANGNDFFSFERSGLDEGVADYFATSYSRSISPYHWQDVFSWDGHNEYWDGRTAQTTLLYPNQTSIYTLGEIWNAAMSNLATDVGIVVADKLMLEAMYFFTNQTTLPEAAVHILQADTLLFGGQFSSLICANFQQKNILDAFCKPTSSSSVQLGLQPQVSNSFGFAEGKSDVTITLPHAEETRFDLYDLTGHCVLQTSNKKGAIRIAPQNFSSGIYVLKCTTANQQYTIKLNRF